MPQPVTTRKPPISPRKASSSYTGALVLYLLLALLPIGFKTLHLTRVATWSWGKATALLWVPWAVMLGLVGLGWGLYLAGRRRG